ncbi:MAG: hypothetical protein ACLR0U_16350 [Enterocloster clostridioformis]
MAGCVSSACGHPTQNADVQTLLSPGERMDVDHHDSFLRIKIEKFVERYRKGGWRVIARAVCKTDSSRFYEEK